MNDYIIFGVGFVVSLVVGSGIWSMITINNRIVEEQEKAKSEAVSDPAT